ncbi:uncharacterized protein LOC110656503 isoform X2 [Hevea brasiliensis]|uniref:uncharacterized protein LOC110656503 isoform X2 n=1 Tax=Hevea brasiliensis TaxID=3981 RepID=UPI0025F4F227|nr:uncharacterized protein LOC110656503 isoform X2 [Hevea brasiliensis]
MDAHHTSLGPQMLEENRQKIALERLSKESSGLDLTKPPIPIDNVGMRKLESGNRLSELQIKDADNDLLLKSLNDLEC